MESKTVILSQKKTKEFYDAARERIKELCEETKANGAAVPPSNAGANPATCLESDPIADGDEDRQFS